MAYIQLHQTGELKKRADRLAARYACCDLCPHHCNVDRTRGERGNCGASDHMRIASVSRHFGEESPISGNSGSGTIFFSHCPLHCIYCQNSDISQNASGQIITPKQLAGHMLDLQASGVHNINLVTPTHYVPGILQALVLATEAGLCIPLVYNSSGWESLEILQQLDGVVDIYMPDCKYSDPVLAGQLSGVTRYPELIGDVLVEMVRQTGPLRCDTEGVAQSGVLIRHLVLPGHLDNTAGVIDLLETHASEATLSILSQYHPAHRALLRQDDLSRFVDREERLVVTERLERSPLSIIRQWH